MRRFGAIKACAKTTTRACACTHPLVAKTKQLWAACRCSRGGCKDLVRTLLEIAFGRDISLELCLVSSLHLKTQQREHTWSMTCHGKKSRRRPAVKGHGPHARPTTACDLCAAFVSAVAQHHHLPSRLKTAWAASVRADPLRLRFGMETNCHAVGPAIARVNPQRIGRKCARPERSSLRGAHLQMFARAAESRLH